MITNKDIAAILGFIFSICVLVRVIIDIFNLYYDKKAIKTVFDLVGYIALAFIGWCWFAWYYLSEILFKL
jgi:hypothetical protein